MSHNPLFAVCCSLMVVYLVGLYVYRIYLPPVAHIPGPLLAKATYWFEFYYDLVLRGQYTFKIKQLQEQYGPIIRINPEEAHIADAEFYDVIMPDHPRGETNGHGFAINSGSRIQS